MMFLELSVHITRAKIYFSNFDEEIQFYPIWWINWRRSIFHSLLGD